MATKLLNGTIANKPNDAQVFKGADEGGCVMGRIWSGFLCGGLLCVVLALGGCSSSNVAPSSSAAESPAADSTNASAQLANSETSESAVPESTASESSSTDSAAPESISADSASSESLSAESTAGDSEPAGSAASSGGDASSQEQGIEADSAGESAGESANEATSFDFVDECADEHGNITLYALTELKGWQVATLLDQLGYEWSDEKTSWVRKSDSAEFTAYKETGFYTLDTYNEMNQKGGAIAAIGYNVVAGYDNPSDALSGIAKCVVEDSFFDGGNGVAVFYGPSMEEYFAIISQLPDDTVRFTIFSKPAVATGMLDQQMGTQVGDAFDDAWKYFTGKQSYGH